MKPFFFSASLLCLALMGGGCLRGGSNLNPLSKPPDPTNGHLIKGVANTTVYYLGQDGKRYVFPNDKTYLSWFPTFSYVKNISDEELIKSPLGGNVTYKPGTRLVKIETDPKVYAVTRGGVLRWIESEEVMRQLFGTDWKTQVDDLPDPFFVNYKSGPSITSANQFSPKDEEKNTTSIDQDKGLSTPAT